MAGWALAVEALEMAGMVKETLKATSDLVKGLGRAWTNMQDTAFKTGRTLAMTREQLEWYHTDLRKYTMELGLYYGKSYKEIAKYQEQYTENVGRAAIVTKENLGYMSALSNLIGETTMMAIVDESDKLGLGIGRAAANAELMQQRAKAFGLNAQKATKTFADNIKLASKYSFRNGIDDIEKMVLKSQSLRMNMDAVMQVADKFMDLDSAIATSANLSMLGGTYATSFGNPLEMAYAANADPTILIDKLESMVKGKVQYNAETGKSHIDPTQMRLLREAAKQIGIDIKELTTPAFAAAENEGIDKELARPGGKSAALSLSDKDRALIQNLARGQFDEERKEHYITYYDEKNGLQKKYISEIDEEVLKELKQTHLGEEEMWGDVRAIRNVLAPMTKRAHDTMSLKEQGEGIGNAWEGVKAFFQNWYMNGLSDAINGLTGLAKFAQGGIVSKDTNIPHAAEGMIIPGDSYIGDKVPAMVNSGEMILNKRQQKGLFDLIGNAPNVAASTWMYGRLGNAVGSGSLGKSALMANVLHGGDADFGDVIETHIFNKFLEGLAANNKGANSPLKVAPSQFKGVGPLKSFANEPEPVKRRFSEFDRELERFKSKWKPQLTKFGDGITNKFSRISEEIGNGFDKLSKRVSNSILGRGVKKTSNFVSKSYKGSWLEKGANKIGGKGGILRNAEAAHLKAVRRIAKTKPIQAIGKGYSKVDAFVKDARALAGKTDLGRINKIFQSGRLSTLAKVSKHGKSLEKFSKVASVSSKLASKASRYASAAKTAAQASKLAKPLMSVAKFGLKKAPIIGTALTVGAGVVSAVNAKSTYDKKVADIEKNNKMSVEDKAKAKDAATKERNTSYGKAAGGVAGSLGGMAAGAAVGAAVGSVVPIVGTAIGGLVGGAIGAVGGEFGGEWLGGKIGGLFGGDHEKKLKEKQAKVKDAGKNLKPSSSAKNKNGDKNSKLSSSAKGKSTTEKTKSSSSSKVVKEAEKQLGAKLPASNIEKGVVKTTQPNGSVSTVKPSNVSKYVNVSENKYLRNPEKESSVSLENTDLGLNVGGTIKLDLGGQTAQIDSEKLLNSPEFRRQLTEMLARSLNENANAGRYNMESARNNMANQYNRTGS